MIAQEVEIHPYFVCALDDTRMTIGMAAEDVLGLELRQPLDTVSQRSRISPGEIHSPGTPVEDQIACDQHLLARPVDGDVTRGMPRRMEHVELQRRSRTEFQNPS